MAEVTFFAQRRQRRRALTLWLFALGLLAAFLLAVGYGALAIAPGPALAIVAAQIGIELPWEFTQQEQAVLLAIRLPRAVAGILVGGALAAAGAALQGLFRNPLADPALIGVSNGAALAAVATIVLGPALTAVLPDVLKQALLPLAAFGGGYVTQSAHSCGGSHGIGPDWVVRTVFPINPLEFIRRGTVAS